MIYDVLIIGGGPGGMYSGVLSSLRWLKSCIIEVTDSLGGQVQKLYSEKKIEDLPGFVEIKGHEFISNLNKQLSIESEFKPDIFLSTAIHSIEKEDNIFIVKTNNNEFKTKSIIIAIGLGIYESIKLDSNEIKILDNSNIHYEYSLNLFNNKKTIILGGGDSSFDWANHLKENKLSNDVSIIHRRDEFRAREDKINKAKNNNIKFFTNKTIKEISNNYITIVDNITNEISKIEYDKILVQYGASFKLNDIKTLFKDMYLDHNKKLLVNMNCKTNIDGIYAIGSAIEYDCSPNMILSSCADAARAIYHLRKWIKENKSE